MAGSTASASFGDWAFNPQILLSVAVLALLFWRGTRATRALLPKNHRLRRRGWQSTCFYASLALAVIALESPIEKLSQSFMWAHMVQHLILIMLVAPLALLGDPVMPLLRGFPLGARRRALGVLLHRRSIRVLGAVLGWMSRPKQAFVLFALTFYSWHFVPFYNATLQSQPLHDLEHATFIAASLLLWWQVIDQTQVRSQLSYFWRAAYMFVAALENHILALILSLSTVPFYAYKNLVRPAGTINALTDQQIAGGIMWVPGMLLFGGAFAIFFYKWLRSQALPVAEPRFNISSTGQILPFEQSA
jgi:cytochrome c oxidase assembly factor CtaG